jgi:hypothetical protein
MPAKIRKRLMGLQFSELAKPRFFRMVDKFIKELIVSTIKKGISPVNQKTAIEKNTGGKSRYQEYSESYINQMGKGSGALKNKKRTPRNLELTGKMLNSIKSMKTQELFKGVVFRQKSQVSQRRGRWKI